MKPSRRKLFFLTFICCNVNSSNKTVMIKWLWCIHHCSLTWIWLHGHSSGVCVCMCVCLCVTLTCHLCSLAVSSVALLWSDTRRFLSSPRQGTESDLESWSPTLSRQTPTDTRAHREHGEYCYVCLNRVVSETSNIMYNLENTWRETKTQVKVNRTGVYRCCTIDRWYVIGFWLLIDTHQHGQQIEMQQFYFYVSTDSSSLSLHHPQHFALTDQNSPTNSTRQKSQKSCERISVTSCSAVRGHCCTAQTVFSRDHTDLELTLNVTLS